MTRLYCFATPIQLADDLFLPMIFTISGLNGKSNNLADVCLRIHLLALGFVYVNVLPIKSFKHVSSLGIAWDVLERCCSLAWKV